MKKLSTPAKPGFNEFESPIMRLFFSKDRKGKPFIDADQVAAAERLRRDFEYSRLQPKMTMSYAEPTASSGQHWRASDNHISNLTDGALGARQRLASALECLGPELTSITYHVCCLASGLEFAERLLAIPPRSGKVVLAIALSKLARHYGLKAKSQSGSLKQWGLEDYRPSTILQEPAARRI